MIFYKFNIFIKYKREMATKVIEREGKQIKEKENRLRF